MPSPSTSITNLRPLDLGGSFEEFDTEMQRQGYVGSRVLPVMEVGLQSSPFGKIPIEQLLQNRETRRAPGSGYARGKFTFTTDSYACEEHGAEEPVDDRESKMYSSFFEAEQVSSKRCFDAVMRNAEQRVSDMIFNATTWTSHTTGITNEWDDAANATPVADIEAAVQSVWDQCGLWPNALIINRKVFRNLRLVTSVAALMKSQGFVDVRPGAINEQVLSVLFDLEHIIVAGGATSSAKEGQSTVIAPIWSDEYAMVCRVATSNDIREPCIGRMMHWGEDGSVIDGRFETYRDETVRSDIVRVRHDVDEKVLYVEAGHLLSNVTS
jgi:hypothetical protein